jgi:GTPase
VEEGAGAGTRPRTPRPVVLLTIRRDTDETRALLDALGFPLAATIFQSRSRGDPATFLGRGKLEEARAALATLPPVSGPRPLLVVDAPLKPTVLFNLEDELKAEVWDRIRLILEIFEANARVKEARLQVELARLRYELPFVHEALHRQLTGEHPGFMGGGELAPRTYETHLRRRTRTIVQELERVKKERRTRRAGRRRSGLRLIAIAGYTNGGKSSLLNELTGAETLARHQVFSTLQTATRRLRPEYHPGRSSELLFTDTVGFIRDLPPWLVDAFASTLEEITEADAVLLVADASDPPPMVEEKLRTALAILDRIHAPRERVILLNKADLVAPHQRTALLQRLRQEAVPPDLPCTYTSTRTGEGVQSVVELLLERVLESRVATIHLDRTRSEHARLEHWLREHTYVLNVEDEDDRHRALHVRCPLPTWGRLLHQAKQTGAEIAAEAST